MTFVPQYIRDEAIDVFIRLVAATVADGDDPDQFLDDLRTGSDLLLAQPTLRQRDRVAIFVDRLVSDVENFARVGNSEGA